MSSSTAIPTSTSVIESAVIKAPLSHVWHHIKLQNFSTFWSALKQSQFVKAQEETDVVKWTFTDGTELEVKQEEHSTINHFITYSVITAKPELTYTSVVSTIRLYPVTSGDHENSTFVEWSGNFSSDADAGMVLLPRHTAASYSSLPGVIQDAKFKRREALADLAKASVKL
ncbi:hypothetical protein BJ170DRAFT_382631 [Xylariales sp. AK1849]|nr:hypothetical protein BJ170DRAFT_382631 [Xylariales sp. AK1849]